MRYLQLILVAGLLFACSGQPEEPPAALANVLFVGDVDFAESYRIAKAMLKDVGYDRPLEDLADILMSADVVVGNLVAPLTDLTESRFVRRKKYIHWSDPEQAAQAYVRHNMLNFSLANNHSMDFDRRGLKQTLAVGKKEGLAFFGAGLTPTDADAPLIRKVTVGSNEVEVVVFAGFEYREKYDNQYSFYVGEFNPGVSKLDAKDTVQRVRDYRKESPEAFIVMFPHWGENYAWRNTDQQTLAHQLIDAGADLIVGHGAHRIQEIERYQNRWIIYNLGNFMFNSPGRYQKLRQQGISVAVSLEFGLEQNELFKRLRLYPLMTDNYVTKYRSRPVTDQEFSTMQSMFAEFEFELSDSQIGKNEFGWFFDLGY